MHIHTYLHTYIYIYIYINRMAALADMPRDLAADEKLRAWVDQGDSILYCTILYYTIL